jgi:hypothetical protein
MERRTVKYAVDRSPDNLNAKSQRMSLPDENRRLNGPKFIAVRQTNQMQSQWDAENFDSMMKLAASKSTVETSKRKRGRSASNDKHAHCSFTHVTTFNPAKKLKLDTAAVDSYVSSKSTIDARLKIQSKTKKEHRSSVRSFVVQPSTPSLMSLRRQKQESRPSS